MRKILSKKHLQSGLTMTELLIVVAILAILFIMALLSWQTQTAKARDGKRKADLKRYSVVLEDYYNDNECYPTSTLLDNCGSTDLNPYLQSVLCDPRTDDPYDYTVDPSCGWYAICTNLENDNDPDIEEVGCSGGCGTGGIYDYCLVVGESIAVVQTGGGGDSGSDSDSGDSDSGGDSGGPYTGNYACDPTGVCNIYADPIAAGCPIAWDDPNCFNLCGNPANWCNQ